MFPVSVKKENELRERMIRLGVKEADFEEEFTRSSGAGGQNVNKTSTCVILKHPPTGLAVRCQTERSQGLNRYKARKTLLDRIEALEKGRASEEQKRIEKIRRQKRKRSARAKAKMLEGKKVQGRKKIARRPVSGEE
ncbi:MAG TPA: peptide chain release factor-like protein [Nitrospiria bacterium]|nr:peptide chain release factor-like protein [Nitrospiria bacterium]